MLLIFSLCLICYFFKATGATTLQSTSVPEQVEETSSQHANCEIITETLPTKNSAIGSPALTPTGGRTTPVLSNHTTLITSSASTASTILPGSTSIRGAVENAGPANSSSAINLPDTAKEEENANLLSRRPSPSLVDAGIPRGMGRGALFSQSSANTSLTSVNELTSNGTIGAVASASELAKKTVLGGDERLTSGGMVSALVSPLSNRMILPPSAKATDGSGLVESGMSGENAPVTGRVFSPPVVSGMQWRSSFNQNETVCLYIHLLMLVFFWPIC